MLLLNQYEQQIKGIEPGETRRFDHTDCPAGVDTRQRLYITRPLSDSNMVIAYCHNCQDSGRWTDGKFESYRDVHNNNRAPVTVSQAVQPPANMVIDMNNWTVDAMRWALGNKLCQSDLDTYRIALDSNTNRVYLPNYGVVTPSTGVVNNFQGYQLRNVEKNRGPKYITAQVEDTMGVTEIRCYDGGNHKLAIIVEDLVSGIHLANALHGKAVLIQVNYGVKVNLEAIAQLADIPKILVWLDNDSPHVMEQARTIARTAGLIHAADIHLELALSDPKNCRLDEIMGVTNGLY